MAIHNILCAGGCGNVQAFTDNAANAVKQKMFCSACAPKQPKPMVVNRPKEIDDTIAAIKAAGTVTPNDIEKIVNLMRSK